MSWHVAPGVPRTLMARAYQRLIEPNNLPQVGRSPNGLFYCLPAEQCLASARPGAALRVWRSYHIAGTTDALWLTSVKDVRSPCAVETD